MNKLIALFVVLASGLVASGQDEAARKIPPEVIPKIQKKLATFKCPEGASVQSCKSFKELVASGDSTVLAPYYALIFDPNVVMTAVFTVFDDEYDTFWVVSSWAYHDPQKGMQVELYYTKFSDGLFVRAADGVVPFVEGKITKMASDGVEVSLDGDTVTAVESFTNLNKRAVTTTITIKVSTLRHRTIWEIGADNARVMNGRAVRLTNKPDIK
jgi:hypothetical protein